MLRSASGKAGRPIARSVLRTLTVCVVDPQSDDYRTWDAVAEERGLTVQTVATAEEALRLAHTQAIDLWVVNTDLPGLSGCELCELLAAHSSTVPVYLVTNEYSSDLERKAWRCGATLFGCKGGHHDWLRQWSLHARRVDRASRHTS